MKRIATFVLLAGLTTTASAQLIVGNDQTNPTIWNVDPTGANPPQALWTGTGGTAWGMAYSFSDNTLYWNNGSVLWSSAFGPTLTPVNLGTMTYGGSNVNFVGLGYYNGKLYGTRNIATEAVYEIDPVTLQATLKYQYNSAYDFGGLDFDPVTGKLYGLSDTAPAGGQRGLYEIDYINQTETFKAPYPAGDTDIDGLAVYNGIAYYVNDTAGQPFYVYDIATGNQLGTIPSPITGSGIFSAATYVPEPAGAVLLALATCLLRRR